MVARLEDEQKVEALRENRGHIHVYAFAGGERPPESNGGGRARDGGRGAGRSGRRKNQA